MPKPISEMVIIILSITGLAKYRISQTKLSSNILMVLRNKVLLHDGQYPLPTPQALGIIIDRLREQGYSFVTVSELLQYNEVRHSFNPFSIFF